MFRSCLLFSSHSPHRLKKEEEANAKNEEQEKLGNKDEKSPLDGLPESRRARAEAWLNANIDPMTFQGRKVFRLGCHPRCISTILGGQGTDPSPVVKKVPELPGGGAPNAFIQPGEIYVTIN